MLAGESIQCLQEALARLRDIWELIGIPEEQRFQRTEVVKHHVKVGSLGVGTRGRNPTSGTDPPTPAQTFPPYAVLPLSS